MVEFIIATLFLTLGVSLVNLGCFYLDEFGSRRDLRLFQTFIGFMIIVLMF